MHKLIQGALFAAIGVLILSSLLIPVVNDAQAETRTVSLNTHPTYTMSEGGDIEITIEKAANSTEIIVNGEVIENHSGILMTSNNFDIRAQGDGQLFVSDLTNNVWIQVAYASSFSLTISEGSGEYSLNAGTVRTISLTGTVFYIDGNGDYGGFIEGSPNVNVTKNQTIYGVFYPVYSGGNWSAFGVVEMKNGEVTDVITSPVISRNNTWVDVTDPAYTVTAQFNDTGDYWTYQKLELNANEFTTRRGEIIAPLEYLEITETDNAVISVIGLMPFILIFALIMGVLGYAVYQRME